MISGYSFRPRLWAALLAVAACAGGIALGQWQAGRAEQKRSLAREFDRALHGPALELPKTRVDAKSYLMKRVAATGRFLPERTLYLANRLRHGHPGYEVVTPLRLDGVSVLVDRGWIGTGPSLGPPPPVPTPAGEVRIEGLGLSHLPRVLQAGAEGRGNVRQNIDISDYSRESGLALQPIAIEQLSPADDGLSREWPRPDFGMERNESYSLQWYALAGLAVVLFVGLSFRRARAH